MTAPYRRPVKQRMGFVHPAPRGMQARGGNTQAFSLRQKFVAWEDRNPVEKIRATYVRLEDDFCCRGSVTVILRLSGRGWEA